MIANQKLGTDIKSNIKIRTKNSDFLFLYLADHTPKGIPKNNTHAIAIRINER